MDSPFIIPLAAFAMAIVIVALVVLAKLHEIETQVAQQLHVEELEHRRKMQDLNQELDRARQGQNA